MGPAAAAFKHEASDYDEIDPSPLYSSIPQRFKNGSTDRNYQIVSQQRSPKPHTKRSPERFLNSHNKLKPLHQQRTVEPEVNFSAMDFEMDAH
jgi:hypothetical protein